MSGGVVAIAGAAGSAGPAAARVLADQGSALSLAGRDEKRLARLVADLGLPDDRVSAHAVDLLDLESAIRWADATASRFGRVDALVHLVGGWRGGQPIADAPPEDDAFLLDQLVRTVQIGSRAFLPALSQSGGRFVLVSSPQAGRPSHTGAAYAAAKAAAEAWTLALADELSGHGGTANIVRVDVIRDPAPVARAIAHLLSDEAAGVNGERLTVDP